MRGSVKRYRKHLTCSFIIRKILLSKSFYVIFIFAPPMPRCGAAVHSAKDTVRSCTKRKVWRKHGIEPTTFHRSERATNCAISPCSSECMLQYTILQRQCAVSTAFIIHNAEQGEASIQSILELVNKASNNRDDEVKIKLRQSLTLY